MMSTLEILEPKTSLDHEVSPDLADNRAKESSEGAGPAEGPGREELTRCWNELMQYPPGERQWRGKQMGLIQYTPEEKMWQARGLYERSIEDLILSGCDEAHIIKELGPYEEAAGITKADRDRYIHNFSPVSLGGAIEFFNKKVNARLLEHASKPDSAPRSREESVDTQPSNPAEERMWRARRQYEKSIHDLVRRGVDEATIIASLGPYEEAAGITKADRDRYLHPTATRLGAGIDFFQKVNARLLEHASAPDSPPEPRNTNAVLNDHGDWVCRNCRSGGCAGNIGDECQWIGMEELAGDINAFREREQREAERRRTEHPEWYPSRHSTAQEHEERIDGHEERIEELEQCNFEYRQVIEDLRRAVKKLEKGFEAAQSTISRQDDTIRRLHARLVTIAPIATATEESFDSRDNVLDRLDSVDRDAFVNSSSSNVIDQEYQFDDPNQPDVAPIQFSAYSRRETAETAHAQHQHDASSKDDGRNAVPGPIYPLLEGQDPALKRKRDNDESTKDTKHLICRLRFTHGRRFL